MYLNDAKRVDFFLEMHLAVKIGKHKKLHEIEEIAQNQSDLGSQIPAPSLTNFIT